MNNWNITSLYSREKDELAKISTPNKHKKTQYALGQLGCEKKCENKIKLRATRQFENIQNC